MFVSENEGGQRPSGAVPGVALAAGTQEAMPGAGRAMTHTLSEVSVKPHVGSVRVF